MKYHCINCLICETINFMLAVMNDAKTRPIFYACQNIPIPRWSFKNMSVYKACIDGKIVFIS